MVLCDFLIELFFKKGGVCLMFETPAFSQGIPKDEDSKNILLDYFVRDA